jgi:hypothetical protein
MSSSVGRSLVEFSIRVSPSPDFVMAILRAFADESGKASDGASRCVSFAAIIGSTDQWRQFDRSWARMLSHAWHRSA